MAIELQGQKIAFLATDGVEQVELKEPWKAVADAGGEPELLSIKEERSRGSTTCADVVRDRKLTSWPSLRTDIRNAGGNWVDEEVVVDGAWSPPQTGRSASLLREDRRTVRRRHALPASREDER
jgi:putative intracellular protease/amidase